MGSLKDVLVTAMRGYAGVGMNGISFLTVSEDQQVFSVVSVAVFMGKRFANASLIVRLLEDQVIIEHDNNDKPLVDALVQMGVPRERIVLAYVGEPAPAVP